MTDLFDRFERKIQCQLTALESSFERKLDQLSQKVDNLYERGSASTIMTHLSVHHYLDAPFPPTSRVFDARHSNETKRLFAYFAQVMQKNYGHLWIDGYQALGVSLRPEQLEVDLLGFAYEKNNQNRPIFRSLKMEPLQANSSYSFIEPFKANVILIGEVTTAIMDFNHEDLTALQKVLSVLSLLPFCFLSSIHYRCREAEVISDLPVIASVAF